MHLSIRWQLKYVLVDLHQKFLNSCQTWLKKGQYFLQDWTNLSERFVKFLCNGFQICDFFISYTNFWGKFCCYIFSFPIASLITDHVFFILSLYLTINLEKTSFFERFLLFQTVAYSLYIHLHFFHFYI